MLNSLQPSYTIWSQTFWTTHWGRVMHICISKLTIIGSDNGLLPGWHQAIIWTNAGILLIWSLGTNFSEMSIEIYTFSFKKMHLKMSSGKWWPFCLTLNVVNIASGKGLWLVTHLAPNHYLNQCWLVSLTNMNKLLWNLNKNTDISFQENAFEYVVYNVTAILSSP